MAGAQTYLFNTMSNMIISNHSYYGSTRTRLSPMATPPERTDRGGELNLPPSKLVAFLGCGAPAGEELNCPGPMETGLVPEMRSTGSCSPSYKLPPRSELKLGVES